MPDLAALLCLVLPLTGMILWLCILLYGWRVIAQGALAAVRKFSQENIRSR